jgi:hypothetical protein
MIIKYKLEYSFGPIGSFAGKFAFFSSILGMIFSEFNVFALIFLHIYIDTEKIRVKFSTTIFGLIPTGKWIDVDDEMEIGIRANQEQWQYIGLSNKSLKLKSTPFKIVLYKSTNKPLLTLKYANTIEQAKQELDSLAKMLQME